MADAPTLPTSFRVNRLVHSWLKLRVRGPRARGLHPSAMTRLCAVKQAIYERALEDFTSTDPTVIREAMGTVTAIMNTPHDAAPSPLPSRIEPDLDIGSTIHDMVQYYLGVTHKLWGTWACRWCKTETPNGLMPVVQGPDVRGDLMNYPAPCANCSGANLSHRWPWRYVEPGVTDAEWDLIGHTDGLFTTIYKEVELWAALEIKSINESGYKENYGPPLPKPEHVEQASLYARTLGLSHIYFVYVNKNALREWKEFLVPVDMEAVARSQQKMTAILEARGGDLPIHMRSCPCIEHKMAGGCPVVEQCWGRLPPPNLIAGDPIEV